MKQTVVDFLESEFNKWAEGRLFIPQQIIEQAKAMEKEQIMDAYRIGYINYLPTTNSEEYYNETFKSH